jgi:hypothetical protein
MFNEYSYKDVYECVKQTANKYDVSEDDVLDVLEETHKGITRYIKNHTKVSINSVSLNYLSGPNIFVFFNNVSGACTGNIRDVLLKQNGTVLGKRVLFLGEHHNIKGVCNDLILKKEGAYEVQDWIVQLCKSTNECIDLFTETPYGSTIDTIVNCGGRKKISEFPDSMSAIVCKLANLGGTIDNLRHHNIDVRKRGGLLEQNGTGLLLPGTELYNIVSTNKHDINYKKYQSIRANYEAHKVRILSYLLTIDKSGYAKTTYHAHLELLFELYGQKFDVQRAEVIEMKYFASAEKELRKMDPAISDNKQRFLYTLLSIYLQQDMFIGLMLPPMDLYFLTRLFIKFDENKMGRTVEKCQNSDVIKNAIIYTGAGHTQIYRSFFEKFFNVQPTLVVGAGGKTQCLKLHQFDYFE